MTTAGMFTSVVTSTVGKGWQASRGKKDEHVSLGARLTISRIDAGLSRERAASCLGASLDTYLQFERGKRAIPAAALVMLQKAFGIDATWILLGSEMLGSPADIRALQTFVADLDRYISSRQLKIAPGRREAIISRWHYARLNDTEVDTHDVLCWLEVLAD
jgi:transcriptional regulator with XRE-family HTH domain